MKVNVLKKAEYDLKVDDMFAMPYNVLSTLGKNIGENNNLDDVMVFSSLDEYHSNMSESEVEAMVDKEKPAYINTKGQLFLFLKGNKVENAANTEENKAE